MAIELRPMTFGRTNTNHGNGGSNEPLPVAQYWLNVGYSVDVTLDNGDVEAKFVSLPVGIALDTMKLLKTNQQSDYTSSFNSARNDLHKQIMDECASLKAGEGKIITIEVQLFRVNEEKAPVKAADNPFSKRLAFA